MKWFKLEEKLPPISYVESDNENDPYESYPVMVFSKESPGIQCVAHLVKEQDENDWNFGRLSWELYIPGEGGHIVNADLETFSHWRKLPKNPA
jgi:hypothetical protein